MQLRKVGSKFQRDLDLFTVLEWDQDGKYLGQWQEDMLDGDGRLWLSATPEFTCNDLTPEEMERACRSKEIPMKYCCETFEAATKDGTDAEGWGQLFELDDEGNFVVSLNLLPIAFCPWCGTVIKKGET
jgi:hypothetical protein